MVEYAPPPFVLQSDSLCCVTMCAYYKPKLNLYYNRLPFRASGGRSPGVGAEEGKKKKKKKKKTPTTTSLEWWTCTRRLVRVTCITISVVLQTA